MSAVEHVERPEAIRLGLASYFTGRPCRRGHIARRCTTNGTCSTCANEANQRARAANPEGARAKRRAYYWSNPRTREAGKRRYPNERAARIKAALDWQKANADLVNEKNRRWRRANPGVVNARTAKQRARRKQATPPWLTPDHHKAMRALYKEASRIGAHVDHIIPLNGKNVCGLHVPWNLQLLPPRENCSKSNKVLA
jgi:hypothetical protein